MDLSVRNRLPQKGKYEFSFRLWMVDDDLMVSALTSRLLKMKYPKSKITSFTNGAEALNTLLELMNENPEELPDYILLDLDMPLLNGFQFLERVSPRYFQLGKQPNIFIYSGKNLWEPKHLLQYRGVRGTLPKPLTIDDADIFADYHHTVVAE